MLLRLMLVLALAGLVAPMLAAKDKEVAKPEVATLDADLSQLKTAFNEAAGEVRLIMLLAPG